MRKNLLILFLGMLLSAGACAQEMLGISNSNYAGVTGLSLNPSSMVHSRLRWDVNIIGADIFLQNNYVYIPRIYSQRSTADSVSDTYRYLKDNYTPNPLKNVYMSIALKLPSVMFRIGKHTIAIQTGYRTALSINDLDYKLAKFAFEEKHLGYTPQHNTLINSGGFKIAAMSWAEIGLSYGYPLINSQKHYLAAAFTIKRAFANAGIYMNSNDFQYMVSPSIVDPKNQDMQIKSMDVEYGHSLTTAGTLFTGGGYGFDVGFSYEKRKGAGSFVPYFKRGKIEKYDYKLGVSVIDIGVIGFTENAKKVRVVAPPAGSTWKDVNTVSLKDLDVFDNNVGTNVNQNPQAPFAGNSFTVGLPTAASVQFDYNLNDKFYLNGTLVQSMPMVQPSIIRPSQISIGPRFETKYFEVAVPYSLYNYTDHRIGVGFRFGPFIVGSDKLGSFLGLNDLTGLDFYFAIKVSSFMENGDGHDPNKCFYKRLFRKFQRKKAAPRSPVVKF